MFSRTRTALVAAFFMPLIALGAWYVLTEPGQEDPSANELGKFLLDSGYYEASPPSRLYGPGTINMVETLSNGALRLHRACNVSEDVLESMWIESSTGNTKIKSHDQNEFIATAQAKALVASDTAGERITRITVSLQDVRVVTMSHEDLIKTQKEYLKGTCAEVVAINLRNGAKVCQTDEVLQADLVYRVSYADGIESTQKAELAKQIAAKTQLTLNESQVEELRGENLYYGIKLSLNCFYLVGEDQLATTSHSATLSDL